MEQQDKSPLEVWYARNKLKILQGIILYLVIANQFQKKTIEKSESKADYYERKYVSHIEADKEAANRVALRAMLRNDTALVRLVDSIYHFPGAGTAGDTGHP